MQTPLYLVFFNVISFLVLISGIFFYTYIFPKKKPSYLFVLILFSILPVLSIFRPGVYESGDFNLHIYRSVEFFANLKEGNLIPSWGGRLNMTYGYPVFIFNYILTYYIVSFFHGVGFTFIDSMKFMLSLSFIFSGIAMYYFAKQIFKKELAAFTAAIFYLFVPYHLIVLHYRVNGEVLGFMFVPFILLLVEKIFQKPNLLFVSLLAILYNLLFLAHSPTAVFFFPLLMSYSFLKLYFERKDNFKKIILVLVGTLYGIALSSYVFLSHLFLSHYTYASKSHGVAHPDFLTLLVSPWKWGYLFQGPKGELGLIIGYTQLLVIFLIGYFFSKKKFGKQTPFVLFWFTTFTAYIFLVSSLSKTLWEMIPVLSIAQFSMRLLLFAGICTSILAGYIVSEKRKFLVFILIGITIFYTVLNWGARRVISTIDDNYMQQNVPIATYGYEGLAFVASPNWLPDDKLWETKIPSSQIDIIQGEGKIKLLRRNQTKHIFISNSSVDLLVRENTLYFPGWEVKIDNKHVTIDYLNKRDIGKIIFRIPKGLHFVEVSYEDVPELSLSKRASVLLYIPILLYFSFFLIKKAEKWLKK